MNPLTALELIYSIIKHISYITNAWSNLHSTVSIYGQALSSTLLEVGEITNNSTSLLLLVWECWYLSYLTGQKLN